MKTGSEAELDVQATRGVRELTSDSAALLEQILDLTDINTPSNHTITVSMDEVEGKQLEIAERDIVTPHEATIGDKFHEGAVVQVLINRYERDPKARLACLAAHGTTCVVCGFDYAYWYGPNFAGFIQVHHLIPLSEVNDGYQVDPVNDLVPICPNCHAAVHHRSPIYKIDELRQIMLDQNLSED